MDEYEFKSDFLKECGVSIMITPEFENIRARNYKSLSKRKETEIINRIQSTNDSFTLEDFIMHNWNLAFEISKPFCKEYPQKREELLMESYAKMIELIYKFDTSKSNKFFSYAKTAIHNHLDRYINESKLIPRPYCQLQDLRKINKVRVNLIKNNGSCTMAEVAKITGFSEEKIRELNSTFKKPISLDRILKKSKHENYNRFASNYNLEEEIEQIDTISYIQRIMDKKLDETKIKILKLRSGLEDGVKNSDVKVAEILGVSKQRIGQQKAATKKILEKDETIKELYRSSTLPAN